MIPLDSIQNITLPQIKDFALVVLAFATLIVLVGNVIKTIKEWRKPQSDLKAWQKSVDDRLKSDHERLKAMEDGNKVVCRGILALLSHEINGNSIDKLKASQSEMTNYLIDR